jgi:hypothetical protein
MTSPPLPEPPKSDLNPGLTSASERLIQRFGGIRPMANKLEIPVTTVQGWKKRGVIPATRLADLRAAAQRHGIKLEEAELEAVCKADERTPTDKAVDEAVAAEPVSGPAELPGSVTLPPFEITSPAESVPLETIPASSVFAESFLASSPLTQPLAESPATAAAAPNRSVISSATGLAIAAALVALAAAGVSVLEPLWSPSPAQPAAVAAANAGTERRLGELETKVGRVALEQEGQAAAQTRRLGSLESRLIAVEKSLPALEQKLATKGAGSPAIAILLAASQLRAALIGAGPFQNEFTALRLTGWTEPPAQADLERIASRAAIGIATEAWLVGRFSSTVAANITRAATMNDPIGRIGDEMLGMLSFVAPPLYRLTGANQGNGPRAIADRAAAWMAAGDFPRAVEQLGELSGLPAEVATPWLSEARARVAADRLRTRLAQTMVELAPAK